MGGRKLQISAVYIITGPNEKMYVGSAYHYPDRWSNHKHELRNNKHPNKKLQNAWNKYGEPLFVFELLEVVPDKQNLLAREQYWIDRLNVYVDGYNMSPNAVSGAGRKHSEETKEKLRAIFTQPEYRDMMSKLHKGKIVSEETRDRQAAAKRGRKHSEETKAKMRATRLANLGRA